MSAVIVVRKRSRVGDIRPGIARTSLQMDDSLVRNSLLVLLLLVDHLKPKLC
jgi:hypothetical protein